MLLISRKLLSSRKPIGRKLTFPKTNLPENTHGRNTRKCISENLRSRQWIPRNQIGYIWSSTSHQRKHNAPNIQISWTQEQQKHCILGDFVRNLPTSKINIRIHTDSSSVFFLHCRTSAWHCRSTAGWEWKWDQNSLGSEQENTTKSQTNTTNQTPKTKPKREACRA